MKHFFTLTRFLLLISLFCSTRFSFSANKTNSCSFIENKGQVFDLNGKPRNDIRFTFLKNGVKLFITDNSIYYQYMNPVSAECMQVHRMSMHLVKASAPSAIIKEGKELAYQNFYLNGKMVKEVKSYSKLIYKNVYPNIDWVIYQKEDAVEYDFILHPGADPQRIAIRYDDMDGIQLDKDGNLRIGTRLGVLQESKPVSMLRESGLAIASSFELQNNILRFQVSNYDKNQTLVIDPTLVWSRYAGGNLDDVVNKVTENMAFGTSSSTFGIATTGGFQTVFGGTKDAFYSYFQNDGTIIYSTYFGGSGNDEGLSGAYVSDGANSKAILVGQTNSNNGISQAGSVTYANLFGASDGFIAVFQANGNLVFSSYFGGNDADYISDVKLFAAANDYTKLLVSGVTSSGFGLGAANSYQGGDDAFLAALDLASNSISVTKSVYYGGTGNEISNTIAEGKNKRYFLSGNTSSTSNIATAGAHDVSLSGAEDDYLACFDENLVTLWATYFGGLNSEKYATRNGSYCDTDTSGNIYLLGNSSSAGLASPGAHDGSINGLEDLFLVKFDSLGNRIWSTYFGGNFSDIASSIDINNYNQLLLGGYSNSPDMEINGMGFVSLSHNNNDIDALLVQFSADGDLVWSSPLGTAQGAEIFNSVYYNNTTIIAGGSTSSAFGMAYTSSSSYGGGGDALIARINDRAIKTLPVTASSICPGDSILIQFSTIGNFPANTIYRAELYPNFSTANPIILGTSTNGNGIIRGYVPIATSSSFSGNSIQVVSNLPSNPPIASTSQSVGAIGSLPNAHIVALTSTVICDGNSVVLKSPSNTNIVFRQWQQFKNNNWQNISGANSISYAADSAGSYRVITTSVTGCDSTSNSISVSVSPVPTATISASSQLFCVGNSLLLNANTGAGYSYQWYKNNSLLPNRISDTLQVTEGAVYRVKVTNSSGCSTSSSNFSVTGLLKPPAQIVALGSTQICFGQSTMLSANNSPGVSYQWFRNDTVIPGATLRTFNVTSSGNYLVKELNTNNCDSTSNAIHLDVYPYPNAVIITPASAYTCLGNSVTLRCANQPNYSFSWMLDGQNISGAVDSFYQAGVSGNYQVIVTNFGLCKDTSAQVEINPKPIATNLCFATIDTAFGKTAVRLVWEKPPVPFIKGYVIFRDIAGQGFVAIDTVSNQLFSSYADTAARPTSNPERYQIATIDSCDQLNDLSLNVTHQTILLQGALDPTGSYIGWDWEPYLGISDAGRFYRVMRDLNGTGVWDSIKATPWSVTSWNDTAVGYPNARYAVDLVWPGNCSPSQRIMAGFNTTRSNIKNRSAIPVGISNVAFQSAFNIYPNPAERSTQISFAAVSKNAELKIFDKLGKCVFEKTLLPISGIVNFTIDLNPYSSGVYTVSFIQGQERIIKKLVIHQ